MSDRDHPDLRILVGAGSFSDAAAALQLLERLPHSLFSGLGGLLITEPDVFAACQIPQQRVVMLSGATTMAPPLTKLRLLMQADAKAFQSALSATAERARADWVFAQDRGDLIDTSLRAAKGWDALLMGYRHVHAKTGSVILVTGAEAVDEKMKAISQTLSRTFSADRVTFSVGASTQGADAPDVSTDYRFFTLDACVRTLARRNALVVLLDLTGGPVLHPTDLARILEAARCPVMIFGASAAPALLAHTMHFPPGPDALAGRNDD